MIDELYDRQYAAARRQLNGSAFDLAARLAASVRNAFEVLNRIEYSAPWMETRTTLRNR